MKTTLLFALVLQGCAFDSGATRQTELNSISTSGSKTIPTQVVFPEVKTVTKVFESVPKEPATPPPNVVRQIYVKKQLAKVQKEQAIDLTESTVTAPPLSDTAVAPVFVQAPIQKTNKYAPDNTGRNKVDKSDETLTPFDQANNSEDIGITVAIRKGILQRRGISFYARNVKIITRAGLVTLRGPVANDEERSWIGELALSVSGVKSIDDQITIMSH